jgi:hypothetical protein
VTRIVPKKLEAPPRRRRKWLLLLPLILLFLWWLWPDGRLARARDLQNELFSDSGQGLSPEDRRSKFQELRNVTRGMSDSQRRELSKEMLKRREDDLRRYTQLPPAEKKQKLDKDIDRQERMRQRTQNNQNGGRPGGFGGGPGGGGPGGAGGSGRPATPQDRENRRKERLDQTTPDFRELMDQYRRDLAARRAERGLPPNPPGRPPRP